MDKKWVILGKKKYQNPTARDVLEVRGFNKKEIEAFLSSKDPSEIDLTSLGIKSSEIDTFISLVKSGISENLPIIIHGDYDVDGICATAILWEHLYKTLGYKKTLPYIPDRFEEGYGLSENSVNGVLKLREKLDQTSKKGLLIIVDAGIGAIKEIDQAKSLGFKVVVVDHHQKGKELPKADAIIWTDKLCSGGIAWFLLSYLKSENGNLPSGLDLAALATIADIQPLVGANRSIVKFGLEAINKTSRIGLMELIKVSGLFGKEIGTYEVGWMLAPRLNASGRLENALISLRLLCTDNESLAREIAKTLDQINSERQKLTIESLTLAKTQVTKDQKGILIVSHETYHEGIIGLVAGRLSQEFYRPAIAISRGEKVSRGSARSISEFNIIEALHHFDHLLLGAGGHPMAAGFSIETEKIEQFITEFVSYGDTLLSEEIAPKITVDLEISLSDVSKDLLNEVENLSPFGVGNPKPIFLVRGLTLENFKTVGATADHLKMVLKDGKRSINAIGFGLGPLAEVLNKDCKLDVLLQIAVNDYNGSKTIEPQIKDLKNAIS